MDILLLLVDFSADLKDINFFYFRVYCKKLWRVLATWKIHIKIIEFMMIQADFFRGGQLIIFPLTAIAILNEHQQQKSTTKKIKKHMTKIE